MKKKDDYDTEYFSIYFHYISSLDKRRCLIYQQLFQANCYYLYHHLKNMLVKIKDLKFRLDMCPQISGFQYSSLKFIYPQEPTLSICFSQNSLLSL